MTKTSPNSTSSAQNSLEEEFEKLQEKLEQERKENDPAEWQKKLFEGDL